MEELLSLKDASPEVLRKWQLKMLEILVYFRDFCEAHGLKFYLAGGTMLGAIRHQGFIPWDDDIDVRMFRDDYEKLIKLWNEEADTSKYVCQYTTKNFCSRFPMATIRSTDTTCIYDHSVNDDMCHGLKIDVEFLDVVPKSWIGKKIGLVVANILALYRTQRLPKRASFTITTIARIVFCIVPTSKLKFYVSSLCEKWIRKNNPPKEDDMVNYLYVANYPMTCFSDIKWVDFEGYKMPIPIGYDEMLRSQYGDYMQLPPENQRKPATDNLVYYDLDHSYLDYKGKYYCVNKNRDV